MPSDYAKLTKLQWNGRKGIGGWIDQMDLSNKNIVFIELGEIEEETVNTFNSFFVDAHLDEIE